MTRRFFVVHVYLTIRNRYLFDNSCPVRGEVCVSIILLGTVMTPGLIYISYREIKSMGWKSFLSLGASMHARRLLTSYQTYVAAVQLYVLQSVTLAFLSVLALCHTKFNERAMDVTIYGITLASSVIVSVIDILSIKAIRQHYSNWLLVSLIFASAISFGVTIVVSLFLGVQSQSAEYVDYSLTETVWEQAVARCLVVGCGMHLYWHSDRPILHSVVETFIPCIGEFSYNAIVIILIPNGMLQILVQFDGWGERIQSIISEESILPPRSSDASIIGRGSLTSSSADVRHFIDP
mmetsp:Transcript_40852/g.65667  ORF Transcript_40852/g.65667 Transcript_40852/m.65667 type:complete len:293 (+) Transcript_40852:458-1336(+)